MEACEEITRHLNSGEKLDPRSPTFKPGWRELIQSSEIDDGPPTRLEHFQAILFDLEVRALREDLVRRWDRHMDSLDAPNASELGGRPEKKAKPYSAKILLAANWYEEHWSNCESAFEEAGFDWNRLLHNTPAGEGVYGATLAIRDLLADQLVPILRARETNIQFEILEQRRKVWLDYLIGFSKKEASYVVVKILNQGIKRKNFDTYSQARRRVQELEDLRPDFERRKALLEKLEPAASSWAHAIRERSAPHDQRKIPGDVVKAWKFRQWDQILTAQHAIDLDALQTKLNAVADVVREVTAEYVEKLAWAAEFERTGLKQQQALTGWLALHKKMGKGTGKHVARLKEEAKKTLVECRQAVPVWIMPLTRVVESFDIATTQFDVVILDEASQNDVLGLVALAMGKEAVVVGDHEQVSPYAVGHDRDKVQGLIDEILVEIPNEQLYDGKTSVYDLARQSFGGTIRLLEHFRCVPDIIQFSNQLCYGGVVW